MRLGSIEFAADNCAIPGSGLLRLLAQAHALKEELVKSCGTSVREIARREGLSRFHFIRLARLAFRAPDITATILEGRQPPDLSARRLIRNARLLPFDWQKNTPHSGSANQVSTERRKTTCAARRANRLTRLHQVTENS